MLRSITADYSSIHFSSGKGSVKDGKMGLVKHGPMPGEDEPLHAYISGSTAEAVANAVEKVTQASLRSSMEGDVPL